MIWFLSDMIMEQVIRDAPVKVASSTSAVKPARWCFMPQAWAVNIHPRPLFCEASLGLRIYLLKILQEISQMVNTLDLFKVGSQSVLQLLQAGCVYICPGEDRLPLM